MESGHGSAANTCPCIRKLKIMSKMATKLLAQTFAFVSAIFYYLQQTEILDQNN